MNEARKRIIKDTKITLRKMYPSKTSDSIIFYGSHQGNNAKCIFRKELAGRIRQLNSYMNDIPFDINADVLEIAVESFFNKYLKKNVNQHIFVILSYNNALEENLMELDRIEESLENDFNDELERSFEKNDNILKELAGK